MPKNEKDITVPTKEDYFPGIPVVVDCDTLQEDDWHKYRLLGIGGSDSPIVVGCSPFATPNGLFHIKRGTPVKLDMDTDKWFIFEYGHAMEDLVARMFAHKTGFEVLVDTRMYRHPKHSFMQANIDRVVKLPDGKIAILECKTTTYFNKDAWKTGPPRYYEIQCRHYMAVCNVDVVYIACIFGNTPADFVCHRIDRDYDLEAELIEAERDFWENHVMVGIAPPYSADAEKEIEVLRKHSGKADPTLPPIQLESEYLPHVEQYLAVQAERKRQEKIVDALKEKEKSLQLPFWEELGTATKCIIPIPREEGSYYEVSASPRSRTKTDLDKLRLVYPDAYADCVSVEEESSRVFSLKKKKKKKGKAS